MDKKYYFLKLLAPRPTFMSDITEEERGIMLEHQSHLKGYMDQGKLIIFGPVLDPNGPYGMGIAVVDNEEEILEIIKTDPVNQLLTYEYYPILAVVPTT